MDTMKIPDGIQEQTKLTFENMKGTISRAGFAMSDIVTVTVYLKNLDDFNAMNEVYASYFRENKPARTTVGVSDLVMRALIVITVTAVKS